MREGASMDELFLEKVHKAIENNLANENFGVEELAHEVGISRIHLHRMLKLLTGQPASQILKEFRLKKAMEMLQTNVATSSEISYQVGFGSPSYFNTCFRQYFGYPPGKVKNQTTFRTKRIPAISRKNLFAGMVVLVILAWIVFYIVSNTVKSEERKITDKSIAILPFRNESSDEENTYFINGIMESVLNNLSRIEDLRVISRNSVEQYRNNPKPSPVIAEEMDVSYLVEASGQRVGNRLLLSVQLIVGREDYHLWSQQYDRNIEQIEDLIDIQQEIAQSIAAEIEAIITPEEKKRIEKIPTRNLTAYDFYWRGQEEYWNNYFETDRRESLESAEDFYLRALEYDPTFALAYTGLARVYREKSRSTDYFSEDFLDSVRILADIALSYDNQLSDAHTLRGEYFRERNHLEQAIKESNKAIDLNPNDWMAYWGKAQIYNAGGDILRSLENLHKCASLYRDGPFLPTIFKHTHYQYALCGFYQKSNYYLGEALKLDGDSAFYYWQLANNGWFYGGDLTMQMDYCMKAYRIDPNDLNYIYGVASLCLDNKQYAESLRYYKIYLERLEELGELGINKMHRLGYAYWENGFYTEADYYFDTMIEYYNDLIKLGRTNAGQLDLAMIYAFTGEKDKAYENLKIFNQDERMPSWAVQIMKSDPFFDNIRDEPEFQQIARDVEAKFQAGHERVRQWLEVNDVVTGSAPGPSPYNQY